MNYFKGIPTTRRFLGYERVYLPLYRVADTPFHIQEDDIYICCCEICKAVHKSICIPFHFALQIFHHRQRTRDVHWLETWVNPPCRSEPPGYLKIILLGVVSVMFVVVFVVVLFDSDHRLELSTYTVLTSPLQLSY